MDVDVVEHEATAVGVHDDAREGVGRREETAAYAARVDVLDGADVLAGQAQVGLPGLLAVGGQVEAGRTEDGAGIGLDRRPHLGVHQRDMSASSATATAAATRKSTRWSGTVTR